MVSALTGIVSYIILLWVSVDYVPFWALLIFMLNYIPTIGSMVAVLLPTTLALVQFDTFGPFVTLLVSLGTVQVLIGNVLEPRLMGSSLNLSPLVVILALSLWGQMWGGDRHVSECAHHRHQHDCAGQFSPDPGHCRGHVGERATEGQRLADIVAAWHSLPAMESEAKAGSPQ